MELITFDATAEFRAFELSELLPTTALVESTSPPPNSPGAVPLDRARLVAEVARKSLVTAQMQPDSIRARDAADRARVQDPRPESLPQLIATAVRAERMALAAKAEEDVSRAELEVLKVPADKQPEAAKKVSDAKTALETARKGIELPGETYSSLIGAVKTLESNQESEDSRRKPFPRTSTGRR